MLISLIVPCYNEEEAMPLFYQEAARVAAQMEKSHGAEFEIIFVDDGSKDGTLRVARKLHDADPRVRYVSFSRNFGKEAGIYAGLKAAKGDYVATLDADLQDPPALLPDMLDALLTGDYDCAATRRTTREGEPPVRSWFARMFYRIINKMSDTEIVDGARDFRLMSRRMVDAVLEMSEYNRFSKGIFSWVGFKTKWFAYQNVERVAGQTKWNFWSLFKYSIEGIVGFSTQPLVMAALAGEEGVDHQDEDDDALGHRKLVHLEKQGCRREEDEEDQVQSPARLGQPLQVFVHRRTSMRSIRKYV